MQFVKGNLWSANADIIFVTTNSSLTQDGRLVMGKGAAKQAAMRHPMLPSVAGTFIRHLSKYGILVFPQYRIGLFQVKYDFKEPAKFELIDHSMYVLSKFMEAYKGNVVLNFPGIGAGNLERKDVLRLLEGYRDTDVTIYEYGE
jgi:hypothetical protein